jgi:phosphatidylinositol N-acetylglucosaminyltransferase subunit C
MTPLPPLPPTPIPPPVPVETHPNRAGGLKPPLQPRVPFDPTHAHSPPRFRPQLENHAVHLRPLDSVVATPAAVAALRPPPAVPGTEPKKHTLGKSGDRRDERHVKAPGRSCYG